NPTALWNLGMTLEDKKLFTEALEPIERSHQLGEKDKSHPSAPADAVATARAHPDQERPLLPTARGQAPAAGAQQAADAARCAYRCKLYETAAGLYADALSADPSLARDPSHGVRQSAACSAAMAGCAERADQAQGAEERAKWRRQALAWLRED